MAKGYIIDPKNNTKYYGYDLLLLDYEVNYTRQNGYQLTGYKVSSDNSDNMLYFNMPVYEDIVKNIGQIKPAKGSKLFLDTKNPYACADIRKSYSITHKKEAADYIVVNSDCLNDKSCNKYVLTIPSLNRMILFNTYYNDASGVEGAKEKVLKLMSNIYPEEMIDESEMLWSVGSIRLNICDSKNDFIEDIIVNGSSKIAFYSSLDLNSGDELSLDALRILRQAALSTDFSSSSEQKCVLAIQMVNNLNWRKYPGTMYRVTQIFRRSRCIYTDMYGHPSKFSKPVREILELNENEFADENDYNLFTDYIKDLVGLDGVKYAKMGDVLKKINNTKIWEEHFYDNFSCITQIKPRTYEDYLSKKQNGDSTD